MKVDTSSYISAFNDFFTTIYKKKIDTLLLTYPSQKSLYINYEDFEKFDPDLADRLVKEPDLVIEAAEEAIRQLNKTVAAGDTFSPHVRFLNLPADNLLVEQISSSSLNQLVSFKCVITKRAEVMHRVKMAVYRCQMCDSEMRLPVSKNFTPPKRCESCKKLALEQIEDESEYVDIQRAESQELLERTKGGAPAAHIELLLTDDIVNKIAPGDNITVIGILRLKPPTKTRQKQDFVYSRYVDCISVVSLKRDFEELEITKDEEVKLKELSKRPDIVEVIINSIAPSIYGHSEVKRAIALQLFGGTRGKTMSGGLAIRDDIHILLIGDPGIAKCTDGDSNVVLADGSVQKIRDMVEEVQKEKEIHSVDDGTYSISNHDILSMNLSGKIEETKATYFWKLEAPEYLYEVETATGKKVKVTGEHPFFISSNGFISPKKAKEIRKDEFIATPRYLSIKGTPQTIATPKKGKTNANRITLPTTLDKNFARLLGYLVGDGYVRRTSSYEINLTNSDQDLITDFSNILKKFSLNSTVRNNEGSSAKTISAFSVELGQILENMGMMKDSFGKRVPQEIMKSPNEIVKEFIKAYFDCKASVGKEGLSVFCASREVLDYVQLLLMRFGIICQIRETYSRATNAKNHKLTKYHRLFILGENAAKYADEIGFTAKIKVKKLSKLKRDFNTNIDVVPNLKTLLKEIRIGLSLTQFECGIPRTTYQHLERGDRNPSNRTLAKISSVFKRSSTNNSKIIEKLSILETVSKSHIFWDKVKRIRKVKPTEKWVYDLQVNDVHNFVANNMFVHNSRFLQSISEIAPKSIYVSGKSVSGAGLTVAAEKDELGEGGWTLKAGALVLASGGMAQVDEFDKIEDEDLAALHEAMESQSISVAKAGIVAKFRTKTAILAAANPKYGRFDTSKNLSDQFEIAPTLLSRFDLIFPIVDVLDPEKDARLADHILATHMGKEEVLNETVDRDILRKYIAYARRKCNPRLMLPASERIKTFYVDLRTRGRDSGSVPITPRYLEGLVRLAESHAKVRLSDTVEELDADVAIALFNYVMQQIMTDKETGLLDVDVVATGKPKSMREREQKADTILDIIRDLLRKNDTAEVDAVVAEAAKAEIDDNAARKILTELLRRGVIYEKEYGHLKIVGE